MPRKRVGGMPVSPKRGAAAAPLQPLLVVAAHLRRLQGQIVRHVGRRGIAEAWVGRRRLVARLRVVGEVAQDGPGRLVEQVEGGAQHAVLELGIVRATERVAKGERHEQGARRLHLLRVLAHHADRRGRDARVSSARASTPPVCVQSGQVGVMSATSTPSSRSRRPTSGPVSLSMRAASRCAPMNE